VECTNEDDDGKPFLLGLIYRSPNSDEENNQKLNALLLEAAELFPSRLCIAGDFNYPGINWTLEQSEAGPNHAATHFLKASKDAFLIQHQKDPTRFRQGQKSNTVDLFFTNREDMVEDLNTLAGVGKSDHFILLASLNITPPKPPATTRYCYAKADFQKLTEILQEVDWKNDMNGLKVEELWLLIKEKIHEAVEKSVPKVMAKQQYKRKWMDGGTLSTVRKKHKLFRRWLETHDGKIYEEYIKARNKATKACRQARKRLEKVVAQKAKDNPKAFWSYVKAKTSTRTGVSDLKKDDGTKTKSDQEKADLLNTFFKSVFTVEGDSPLPDPPVFQLSQALEDFNVDEEEVKKLLKDLKTNKAAGPDEISPLVLSRAADVLAYPFAQLFRLSLDSGEVPRDWKNATVTPIFKKGSRLVPSNYRPVSLTCIACKLMESLVRKNIMNHLQEQKLITREQHGFVKGRSCVTQLLDVLDSWTETIDNGGSVDVIYMDFQKAFDSVPYKRLLSKLSAHGIQGKVLSWLEAFLTDRRQVVQVNGARSAEALVTSGIPQGSVVGPLMFVVYINDLPTVCSNQVKLFADDTKLFARSDLPDATTSIQDDLNSLQKWSDNWLLKFHPEKCHVLKLGSKKSTAKYSMNGKKDGQDTVIELEESEVEKDLGVFIDNNLSFKEHVSKSTAKANRMLGIIRRSFDHLTEPMFVQLYKAMVRPVLEYGHSAWQPHHKTLCSEVEDVQRRATKLLSTLKDKPYPERLAALRLPTLEHRRKRGDMIDVYKYLHNEYDTDRPRLQLATQSATRGNSLKLAKGFSKLNVRSNYFSQRVTNTWNSLPDSVVTAPSVNTFKSRLDSFWGKLPTLYNPECQC
jgi:hypothetical protein